MVDTTCVKRLASFPNTRERPRRPTQSAITYAVAALISAVGPLDTSTTAVTAANIGQQTTQGNTVVAPANPDRTYLTLRNLDPTEAVVYGYTDNPALDTEGMILRAGDSVDLDSIDNVIYVRSIGATPVDCRIDRGVA